MTMTPHLIRHFSHGFHPRKSIITVASNHHVLISLHKRNIGYVSCSPKRPYGFLTTKRLVWEFARCFYLDKSKDYVFPIHPSLQAFLQDIDKLPLSGNPIFAPAKTRTDLSHRSTCIVQKVKEFYETNGTQKPLIDRTQLIWYQNEVFEYSKLHLTPKMEKYWKRGIKKSGRDYEKADDILKTIKSNNQDHLRNSFAQECRVNVVDPRKLFYRTRLRDQGAMSTLDGVIWINKLMVQNFTDDQLAYIIGHEMAHILLEHIAEDYSIEFASEMIMHHAFVALSNGVRNDLKSPEMYKIGIKMMKEIREVFPGDTNRELEADKVGTFLMAKSFHPDATMQTFKDWQEGIESKNFSGGFMYVRGIKPDHKHMFIDYEDLYDQFHDDLERFHSVQDMVSKHRYRPRHADDDKRAVYAMDTFYHEATFIYYAEQLKRQEESERGSRV